MPDTMNYLRELTDEVGPRPASTEEEHQAAQRIAEWFEQRRLETSIEEFNCPPWVDWPYIACYLLAFIATLITAFHGVVGVLALVLAVIALAAFAYERYLSGSLAGFLGKGLSQNVVARYVPKSSDRGRRKRKIIIVAHYDSERSALEASPLLVNYYPLLQKIVLGCMLAIPVLMIVQMIPAVAGILNILWSITCIVALIPLAAAIGLLIRRFVLRYPNGANDNASGVAAMMSAFEQIVPTGDEADAAPRALEEPRRHNARRAREAGVVPDDAEVEYHHTRSSHAEELRDDEAHTSERENGAAVPHATEHGSNGQAAAVAAAAAAATAGVAQGAGDAIEQKLEKTAGTSDAVPRKKYSPSYEVSGATQGSRNADVPDWWARVESKRKETQGNENSEAFSKARSRFADLPSSDYKRESQIEKEKQEAEERAKAALAAQAQAKAALAAQVSKAAAASEPANEPETAAAITKQTTQSIPRHPSFDATKSPAAQEAAEQDVQAKAKEDEAEEAAIKQATVKEVEATKPQKPIAPPVDEARKPASLQIQVQAAKAQEKTEREMALEGLPSLSDTPKDQPQARKTQARETQARKTPLTGETRAMPPIAQVDESPEPSSAKVINLSSRLAHLPSLEDDDFFDDLSTEEDKPAAQQLSKPVSLSKIPEIQETQDSSLMDDDDFGMAQPTSISSSYSDTPQSGASNDFGGSGSLEPVITRVEGSDSFSPLQAGTFSIGETGAFVPIGNTGSFDTSDVMEEDIFIEDADDSSLQSKASAGEFDTPNNIDIPASRTHKLMDSVSDFFSRDKKKNKADKAINEWLDVEEDFEATSAGRDIGTWDHFNDDQAKPAPTAGGQAGPQASSHTSPDEYEFDDAIIEEEYYAEGEDDYLTALDDDDDAFKWKGGGASSAEDDTREQVARIRDSVLSQSNSDLLNKEIWFVALGAGGSDHAGMKAFLAEHQHELSGATFINLECVGAGELSYVESEGVGFTRSADRRLQGLLQKIARATDLDIIGRKLNWRSTELTPALKAGYRGVTLMAFGGTAPVAWRQKEDTMAIIEPSCVEDAGNLLVEIIRNS